MSSFSVKMGVFYIRIFREVAVLVRTSIKLVILVIVSMFLAVGAVVLFYHPTYEVSLNGEVIGYTANKSNLQAKVNEYISSKEEENIAFVQVDAMPTYKLCLLKNGMETNDEDIYEKITGNGTKYYKYYAITDDKKEKVYVATFKEAEEILENLKKKESANIDDVGIVEKYDTELKNFTSVEKSISKLYEEKPVVVYTASTTYSSPSASNYSSGVSSTKISLGISLIKPVSGTITSRFGSRDSARDHAHTGIDIGAPNGTPIKAAASGTVTYSGSCGDGYGNYVIISHGNGVQTLYAHCSQLLVSEGQKVSQGEAIAKVGSTGNSTGNHLHLEVRKNGITYDPQNYVY